MNIDIFKRNVSLLKLGIAELDENEKKLHDFLVGNISGLNQYLGEKYPLDIYFGNSKEDIYFYYDSKNDCLCVTKDRIYFFLNNELGVRYIDIELLILFWFEITFGFKLKRN